MMIFFRGVSPHFFDPFGHSMTKGEKFELVFKRVLYMGGFLFSYNSCFSEVFDLMSCKLKSYGGLILLNCFLHAYFLKYLNARMLNFIRPHISSCISNSSYHMINMCMNYKI